MKTLSLGSSFTQNVMSLQGILDITLSIKTAGFGDIKPLSVTTTECAFNYITGVEKKNDVAKILYHRKSNRWDFTADLLRDDYIMHELKVCERPKRKYR